MPRRLNPQHSPAKLEYDGAVQPPHVNRMLNCMLNRGPLEIDHCPDEAQAGPELCRALSSALDSS